MLNRYYCANCHTYEETSECHNCHSRTVRVDCVGWSDEYNIPVFTALDEPSIRTILKQIEDGKKGFSRVDSENPFSFCDKDFHGIKNLKVNDDNLRYISNDIRPVFPEERLLLELLLGCPLQYINSSCWSTKGGTYVIDGKVVKIKVKDLRDYLTKNPVTSARKIDSLREDYKKYSVDNSYDGFNKYTQLFIEKNKERFDGNDEEALRYIDQYKSNFDKSSSFVSFSGGKDSTVVSDLVLRGIGDPRILHIFGDTTLEFPETYEYVKRFKKEHNLTPMMSAKNREKNFYDMCEVIGPPSRVMRWCCTVFKTGAIQNYTNSMFRNKSRITTFFGIRRAESASRSKYDRDSDSPKITKQRTVSPIIDWLDGDVWLYILTRHIDFNDAYRYGFARVGCWCCPNNSQWSEFLSCLHHEEQFNQFRNMLVENAEKIGKPDPDEYVDSGAWKAKQGGDGIEYGKKKVVTFEPCALEENAFNYELQKPIDDNLYEMFKPLGELNFDLGSQRLGEVYVLDKRKRVILKLQGKKGETRLKVSIINLPIAGARTVKDAKGKIECQITKFQMCLNCSACMSVCRFGAIKITLNNDQLKYKVDENKCVHCFECVNHFSAGCYLRKVLMTKEEK